MNSTEKRTGTFELVTYGYNGNVLEKQTLHGSYDEDQIEFIGGEMMDRNPDGFNTEVRLDGVLQ